MSEHSLFACSLSERRRRRIEDRCENEMRNVFDGQSCDNGHDAQLVVSCNTWSCVCDSVVKEDQKRVQQDRQLGKYIFCLCILFCWFVIVSMVLPGAQGEFQGHPEDHTKSY